MTANRYVPPVDVTQLKGTRVPVVARDKQDAISVAKQRPWWTRCLNPDKPIAEHGRYWFVLADDPISGLAELARTAKKPTDTDTEQEKERCPEDNSR